MSPKKSIILLELQKLMPVIQQWTTEQEPCVLIWSKFRLFDSLTGSVIRWVCAVLGYYYETEWLWRTTTSDTSTNNVRSDPSIRSWRCVDTLTAGSAPGDETRYSFDRNLGAPQNRFGLSGEVLSKYGWEFQFFIYLCLTPTASGQL
jgi:hypothetical protein